MTDAADASWDPPTGVEIDYIVLYTDNGPTRLERVVERWPWMARLPFVGRFLPDCIIWAGKLDD